MPHTRPYLFVTAKFVRLRAVGPNDFALVPSSIVHAKEMGTTRTVCGEDASSWTKLWEQSFWTFKGDRCFACAEGSVADRRFMKRF